MGKPINFLARPRENRGSARERGYTWRWQKARATFLRNNPLCVKCREAGRITPATVVDHIVPHKGDSALFWDTSNWQALCDADPWRCHSSVKQREERGKAQPIGEDGWPIT